MQLLLKFSVVLLFFSACGPESDAIEGVLEVGTGTTGYEPIPVSMELPLIAGIQGGYHFIVNARMQGFAPGDPKIPGHSDNPSTLFSLFTEAGEQIDILAPAYQIGYKPSEMAAEDWYELASGRILRIDQQLVDSGAVSDLWGKPLRLHAEIQDSKQRATAEIPVIPIPAPR